MQILANLNLSNLYGSVRLTPHKNKKENFMKKIISIFICFLSLKIMFFDFCPSDCTSKCRNHLDRTQNSKARLL